MSENKTATLETDDENDTLSMLKDPLASHETPESACATVTDETVNIDIEYGIPNTEYLNAEFDVETRVVNEFAHFESYKNSSGQQTYTRYNATKIRVLYRVDDEWLYGTPKTDPSVRQKAAYPQSDLEADNHLPTQVDGITSRNVASRGRGNDTFTEDRYKVTREFVERVDEAYVLQWDEKYESGRKGSHTKRSNETAYKLVVEE